ncbi:MAG TPA: hypothetical protein VJ768_08725 [Anaerolineales bacterium]|nr:hypothetical protein [Anaerolineales bacterium]
MVWIKVLAFSLGLALVGVTISAVTRSFVLPRGENVRLTLSIFRAIRLFFELELRLTRNYTRRDRIMALFAPTALVVTPAVMLTLILIGYTAMFWAIGVEPVERAFWMSGSALLTLGFAPVTTLTQTILAFTEAMIGLGLIALLIAYLPAIYSAFSARENLVALLEVYAGSPPSAFELISRASRIRGLGYLGELWTSWEIWFAALEESHTSLLILAYFRSPSPDRSWVTAAGTVLDAAALAASTLDIPPDPRANLCIRAGYLALRSLARLFGIRYNPDPKPYDPISIQREEFDRTCDMLLESGIPLKNDRDQAWKDFSGWRVNYDRVLLSLAELTMAPYASWTSDRPAPKWVEPE